MVSMLSGIVVANGSKNRRFRRKMGPACAAARSESRELPEKTISEDPLNSLYKLYTKGTEVDKKKGYIFVKLYG